MDAKQLINKCEQWSKEDRNNHRAAVILSDAKTQQYYIHYAGDYRAMRIKVNDDIDAMIMPNKYCRSTAQITLNPIKK